MTIRHSLRAWMIHPLVAIYTGGTLFHLLRPIVGIAWYDIPFFTDWIILIFGSVGLAGLIMFRHEIAYRGRWEIVTHWVMVVHLAVSLVEHLWIIIVHSHEVLAVFPMGYSYFALVYFGFFAWRLWTLKWRPGVEAHTSDAVGVQHAGE